MKKKLIIYSLLLLAGTYFIACENEDEDNEKPVISNLEVGHDDTIHAGEKIHIAFEVSDNEALDYFSITIHAEEEHKSSGEHWVFDSTFTEIDGLKNSSVHHDIIAVPAEAEEGFYHFHLKVVDKAGNSASEDRDIYLSHEEDDHEHEDHNHDDDDHDEEEDHEHEEDGH